jgi:hypothetical protein
MFIAQFIHFLNEFIALFIQYFFSNCYVILQHGTIDRKERCVSVGWRRMPDNHAFFGCPYPNARSSQRLTNREL